MNDYMIFIFIPTASNDELWIGLNDRTTEGLFDWSDYTTVTFTSWGFGEPTVSIESEDCVLITGEVWHICFCSLYTYTNVIFCIPLHTMFIIKPISVESIHITNQLVRSDAFTYPCNTFITVYRKH